jgi:hypothetical protein
MRWRTSDGGKATEVDTPRPTAFRWLAALLLGIAAIALLFAAIRFLIRHWCWACG